MHEIGTMEKEPSTVREILEDPGFQSLVRRKTAVSVGLSLATMAVYYGFIFLIAFDKSFLARMITENVTLGIPMGVGVILVTCLFTGLYVYWANVDYDPAVTGFKSRLEGK
jgi:uncharacterized membrane protein (DUF485 family)